MEFTKISENVFSEDSLPRMVEENTSDGGWVRTPTS